MNGNFQEIINFDKAMENLFLGDMVQEGAEVQATTPVARITRKAIIDLADGVHAKHENELNAEISAAEDDLTGQERIDRLARLDADRKALASAKEARHSAELAAAIREGDAEIVDWLLKNNTNPNIPNKEGQTALHIACEAALKTEPGSSHRQILYRLLSFNNKEMLLFNLHEIKRDSPDLFVGDDPGVRVQPNALNGDGNTILHMAVQARDRHVVSLILLNRLTNPNIKDREGKTALDRAVEIGDLEIISGLLSDQRLHLHPRDAVFEVFDSAKSNPDVLFLLNREVAKRMSRHNKIEHDEETNLYDAARSNESDKVKMWLGIFDGREGNTAVANALHRGIKEDCQAVIDMLLKNKAVNDINNSGNVTVLQVAVMRDDLKLGLLLLKHESRFNLCDSDHKTPLDLAMEKGSASMIFLLQAVGAKTRRAVCAEERVEYKYGHNGTFLSAIEKNSQEDITHYFDKINVNYYSPDYGSHLGKAIKYGRQEIVNKLLDKGADINFRDDEGRAPLDLAAMFGQADMIPLLLEKGADIAARSDTGATALHVAAMYGQHKVVSTLLANHAEINARNDQGCTPLEIAVMFGHMDVVTLLLEKGANCRVTNTMGANLLHLAVMYGHSELIEFFMMRKVDLGVDVNAFRQDGETALTIAVRNRDAKSVALLLDNGADLTMPDKEGNTGLMIAVMNGDIPMVNKLLDKGANLEDRNHEGWSALDIAAMQGNLALVELLLEKGAKLDGRNENGETALMWAVVLGHSKVVEALVAKDADINARNKDNETAFDMRDKAKKLEDPTRHPRSAMTLLDASRDGASGSAREPASSVGSESKDP